MSIIRRAVVITCDWRGCQATYWLTGTPYPTLEYTRRKAAEQGWQTTDGSVWELCPDHAGRQPIER